MLNNPKSLTEEHLHGIVEFYETYFLESQKGTRHLDRKPRKRGGSASQREISSEQTAVLVARDRNKNTMDAILFKSNQDTLAEVMVPVVDKDALLCSDKKTSYNAFANKYHFTLKESTPVPKSMSKRESIIFKMLMLMIVDLKNG